MKVRSNPGCHGNLTIANQNIWHFSHMQELGHGSWRIGELGIGGGGGGGG